MEKIADIDITRPPRRNPARKAVAVFADQFSEDAGVEGSIDEMVPSTWKGRASSKLKTGKKASGRKRAAVKESTTNELLGGSRFKENTGPRPKTAAVIPSSMEPPPPAPRPRPQPKPKKPVIEVTILVPPPHTEGNADDTELSDLTWLSSSEDERRSPSPEIITVEDVHKQIPPSPSQSHPPHALSLATQLRVASKPSKEKPRNESLWSLSGLGTYVWVLIEHKSWRVFDEHEDGEDHKERVWWPGKITSSQVTDTPLKVKLFGAGVDETRIPTPCSGNILSKCGRNFRPRFQIPTFVLPKPHSKSDDILASPKKKQKRDRGGIERRWEAAVAEMGLDAGEVVASSDSSEDFPEIGDMFKHLTAPGPASSLSQSISKSNSMARNDHKIGTPSGSGKRKRRSSAGDEGRKMALVMKEEDFWEPPPLDDGMTIPGELVLARDKVSTNVSYWPGQLQAYIPPVTRKQQAKFTVMWLDGTTQDIPRSWFYRVEDDGFASCKLGEFKSEIIEVQNDEDDPNSRDNVARKSPSPITLAPPPSMEDFLELSIREQFVYTKAILKAILMFEYEPVKDKHRRFMRGGKQRESVLAGAGLRGKMDPKHVELLQEYIKEWCLRDEARVAEPIEDFVHGDEAAVGEVRVAGGMDEDLGVQAREREGSPLPDNDVDKGVIRSLSPPITEAMVVSSPPAMPPSSSFPTSKSDREGSVVSNTSSLGPLAQASTASFAVPSMSTTEPLTIDDINDDISNLTNMDDEQSTAEFRPRPRQRGCDDFESLSPVGKIAYCSDILLPEAVRQILLWRTDTRTSAELLSAQEEKRLYEKGEELLLETDWVFDVMRFRGSRQALINKAPKNQNGGSSLVRTASKGR